MSYLYFCFKKSFLVFCAIFSFYSSVYAMLDEFDGELSYNATTNTTMCKCRSNPSQSLNMTSTSDSWKNNWEPNVVTGIVTGLSFLIIDDLTTYDFNNKTYNSRIVRCLTDVMWPCCTGTVWPFCTNTATGCWKGTTEFCKSSNCCKKHNKNKVKVSLDTSSGTVVSVQQSID